LGKHLIPWKSRKKVWT